MVTVMRRIKRVGVEPVLYPWGKAEITDKWVILYKKGGPRWAICYRQKRPSIAIPCRHRDPQQKHFR